MCPHATCPGTRSCFVWGRFHGIAGAYANYTPPTLYLFALASFLGKWIAPVVLLKAVNLPFILISAGLSYEIGLKLGATKQLAGFVSTLTFALPEVWQNAFHWGQYDSVFTTFLLGCCFMIVVRQPTIAMLLVGIALAFKLQAVFVGPAILALLIAGEIPPVCRIGSAICLLSLLGTRSCCGATVGSASHDLFAAV